MEQFRLIVFEAVCATGSYTKAARQLGITQPAVSQNIAELEKELGTALFVRAAAVPATDGAASGDEEPVAGQVRVGKMTPTPAAEVFIRLVRKVLKGYDDIRVLFNPAAAEYGIVHIRADRSATEYALPKVLSVLRAAHPTVNFEVLPADTTEDTATAEASESAAPVASDVIITTIPTGQNGAISLRFEVFGPATPFVEAVRLILSAPDMADMAGANH